MSWLSWISCINLEFSLLYSLFSLVIYFIIAVQSLSCDWIFTIPWIAVQKAPLPFTISQGLLRFMSIELVMHLILCRPLLLLPSIFPSTRVFSKELALRNRWPEYWTSASASVSILNTVSVVYMWQSQYIFNMWKKQTREWHIPVERSADCDRVPGGYRFLFSLIPKPWLYSDLFTATCLPIKFCLAQAGLIGFLPHSSKRVLIH